MDVTDLQFADDLFDFILCSHVLEHVDADAVAISELHRVLRPGGFGIIQVPVDYTREATYEDPDIRTPETRAVAYGQFDHVRLYGRDFIDRLKVAGFDVELVDVASRYTDYEQFKYGIAQHEPLYVVKKLKRSV